MTFQEYLNQPDPQKLGVGTVLVDKESDAESWWFYGGVTEVVLKIRDRHFHYRTNQERYPGSTVLWTMDEDGNPKSLSVFKLID